MPIEAISSTALGKLELSPDEVHVWRAPLDLDPDTLSGLKTTLAPDEISRAGRFVFPRDRHRFVAARGILRQLLAAYLVCSPRSLRFHYGQYGKPALHPGNPEVSLQFNLSHSQGLALYVFGINRAVGVDLELIRPDFGGEELAQHFFSPREQMDLHALPPDLIAKGFYNCWTRKEAYVKARGDGLQIPLDSFDVSLIPGCRETLNSTDSSRWELRSFELEPQFVAAIVAEGSGWELRHFEWRTTVPPTAHTAC
jgi:4'-phosphopantetheinyl transferase